MLLRLAIDVGHGLALAVDNHDPGLRFGRMAAEADSDLMPIVGKQRDAGAVGQPGLFIGPVRRAHTA